MSRKRSGQRWKSSAQMDCHGRDFKIFMRCRLAFLKWKVTSQKKPKMIAKANNNNKSMKEEKGKN